MYCGSQGIFSSWNCGIEMQNFIHFKVGEMACDDVVNLRRGVANLDRHEGHTTRHPVFRVRTWRSPDPVHRDPANNCSRPLSERGTGGGVLADPANIELAGITQIDQPTGAGGKSDLWYFHMSRTSSQYGETQRSLHYARDVPCIEQIIARARRMPLRPAYAVRSSIPHAHLLPGELPHMPL